MMLPRTAFPRSLAVIALAVVVAPRISHADPPVAAALRSVPPAPWWTRDDLGPPRGPLAQMWSEPIGSIGGLALHGTGEGSDTPATGIRIDAIRTVGQGNGLADVSAVDGGHSRVPGSHTMRALPSELAARYQLPPETIQRVVRDSYGAFLLCYEAGRRHNPALAGRVAVKFVIDKVGNVSLAADHGSDLPDPDVVTCVVRGFASLTFPPSPDGSATVVYPLVFAPDTSTEEAHL